VTRLVEKIQQPGYCQIHFDGSDLPNGIYFYYLVVMLIMQQVMSGMNNLAK
jgi:hypothetical protein